MINLLFIWLRETTGICFQNHAKWWHIWNLYPFEDFYYMQKFLLYYDMQDQTKYESSPTLSSLKSITLDAIV
jgi:hypothetical protein